MRQAGAVMIGIMDFSYSVVYKNQSQLNDADPFACDYSQRMKNLSAQ